MKMKLLTAFLFLVLTSTQTLAARPSINELNTRVNQLEADVNQLDSRVTTNESDINANSTLIDDNTSRINGLRPSVSVLANGARIGTYLGTADQAKLVMIMNDREHIFYINIMSGDLVRPVAVVNVGIVYTTEDCTGQGYLQESDLERIFGLGGLLKGSGYVFDNAGTLYYSPINSVTLQAEWRSFNWTFDSTCRSVSDFSDTPDTNLYSVFPNDPAVTGVSTSSFDLPLSLGFE